MAEQIIKVNTGRLPTAKEAEEIRSKLTRADITVEAPLVKLDNDSGTHLSLESPTSIWAKVSGWSSPYSFSEGRRNKEDAWTDCCLTGTANAYEANDVPGLDGTYQLLHPGTKGDWRFVAVRKGNEPPPKPCNTGLSVAMYGCGLSTNWTGKTPKITITRPDGQVVSVNNGSASTALDKNGTYTITGSAKDYLTRSYTFQYDKCDGINYFVALSLTPTSVFITGSACGNAKVNVTATGAFSGSCVTFGTIQITNQLEAGGAVTYTGTKDRYKSVTRTSNVVAPNLTDTATTKYIKVGGTLQFCGADMSLEPEDCYFCWQDSRDVPFDQKGYFCEYPVARYWQVDTPIGSIVLPAMGEGFIEYTTEVSTGCCTGSTTKPYRFRVSSTGGITWQTCENVGDTCGGKPYDSSECPFIPGYGASNQGRLPSDYFARCTGPVTSYCPPGLIMEYDTYEAGVATGHTVISEYGCGPGPYGNFSPADPTEEAIEPSPGPVQARRPVDLDPDTIASLNPSFAAELVDDGSPKLVPLAESIRLTRAAKSCPHRTAPACGCPSVPGSCALGKGGTRGVTLADCLNCIRDDGVTMEAHLNGYTGYGQHSTALAKELEKLGHPVAFRPIERDDAGFIPLEEFTKRRITS